mgnify:CR=1 FL=1
MNTKLRETTLEHWLKFTTEVTTTSAVQYNKII